ncbi:MAG TPA: choice-of-anchor D domain-containing protein, partial [Kineosporiaceae bacterium]|nr:choice-of-anchor D domain-containing protein [Kineosporiaceae bacterium]
NVSGTTTTFTDHNTVGTHTYEVDATDSASPGVDGNAQGQPYGNRSAHSNVVTVNAADNTPPSVPANLVAKLDATGKIVTVNWSASTDDVGVASYAVYRRQAGTTTFTKLADVTAPTTSYTDKDPALKVGTKYEYTVDAVDAANNRSAQAAPPATVTVGADTVAPNVPTAFSATTPDIHSRDVRVAWTAPSDNVGVTGYGIYRHQVDPSQAVQPALVKIADVNSTAAAGTAVSFTDPKLPAGTYEYQVDAVDSAGNRSAKTALSRVVTANDPPTGTHTIQPFYARDFVSSTGWKLSEGPITVSVIRAGRTVGVSNPITPVEDPATPGLGAVEVNHPGGGCWGTAAAPNTPNLQPGDVVRFTNKFGVAEQTTVANVVADRPIVTANNAGGGGTVVVHGTAADATGKQIPVDQIESRLIANRDAFDLTGRRTLRAGGAGTDGTLKYDTATGTAWTATYQLPTDDDLARAAGGTSTSTGTAFVGAESRGLWLGRDPLALNELTFHENGAGVAGGPVAGITGCTSGPAETPVPAASLNTTGLSFQNQGVGSAQSAAQNVVLSNPGGSALTINRVYLAGLNPKDYVITSQGCPIAPATLAAGRTCTVSVAFKAQAAGLRQANLSFTDNAANTTDQTVALTATAIDTTLAAPGAPVQSLSTANPLTVASVTAQSTMPVTLSWTPSASAGITGYQVEQSDNGGAFSPVSVAAGATNASASIALGTLSAPISHQWRVRACKATGCSVWTLGPKVTSAPIDNNTSTSYNGTFSSQNVAGAFGGSVQFSSTANSRATTSQAFAVAGNVAWISTKGPDRGRATVSVDGGAPTSVDLYSPTRQNAAVVWVANGLTSGATHTVVVTVVGASNTASTGSRVDHDAMVYLR